MSARFDGFICLAEMRTGSNFLEENLNRIPGLRCWGEAFNPAFIGHADREEMAGVTLAAREADPTVLIDAIRARTDGLAGFRFFHDHDPRILDRSLSDARVAKIVLIRNPLESYVSLKIARATNQWRLGEGGTARRAAVTFDPAEFGAHLGEIRSFQAHVLRRLQVTGQTAFYINYEEAGDIEVLNGLAAWLGVAGRIGAVSDKTRVQNPAPLADKVTNYAEMVAALSDIDHFGLSETPNFEPRCGPNVPAYLTAARAPLLYMPVRGGPEADVAQWLAALDGVETGDLGAGLTQKDLRRWKRAHPGHRSLTVLRHPAERAHDVFCRQILASGSDAHAETRAVLRARHGVAIPPDGIDATWDARSHATAFMQFLDFVRSNLNGQTGLRVDPAWATQTALVQGMAEVLLPDLILREDDLPVALPELAARLGWPPVPYRATVSDAPHALGDILTPEIDALVADVYRRDFVMFGFTPRA